MSLNGNRPKEAKTSTNSKDFQFLVSSRSTLETFESFGEKFTSHARVRVGINLENHIHFSTKKNLNIFI